MADHPYQRQPDYAFWRRSFDGIPPAHVDPVIRAPFRIRQSDKIVTAGSCFAQHIARHLRERGFNYHVTEKAHPIVPQELAEQHNYGVFSARYGNIYTTAQLLQLFKRAYGTFEPRERAWTGENGETLDPFRPLIQPGGYIHEQEMLADRRQHLACVRRAFEELDVFVFTLGLTEHWRSREDGAVFPLCPGTAGGTFDPAKYEFANSDVNQVISELEAFIDLLRSVNPRARVILTVSPVPLVATAEDRHVLVSTTYSKSVLRVAAEAVSRSRSDVAYFPSYEIVTGNFSRGRYFAEDLRSIREAGVRHVMRLFFKHYADRPRPGAATANPRRDERARPREPAGARRPAAQREAKQPEANSAGSRTAGRDPFYAEMERLVEVECDEEALDKK